MISGYVKNAKTNQALPQVNITVKGSNTGTISNQSGFFRLKIDHSPADVLFSSVGFSSEEISLSTARNAVYHVFMSPQITELEAVTVYANKIKNLVKDEPLFVSDYEFHGDDLLLFAYRYKKVSKAELILINNDGDTITSKAVSQAERFYRDCLNNLHLITRNYAFQLFIDSNQIFMLYPTPLYEFHQNMDPLVASLDDKFFLHQYYYRNQVLQYYFFNTIDSTFHDLRVIEDVKTLRMLYDNDRWGNFGYVNEFHKRFEDLFFADPIYAPLLITHDSLVILNFVDGQIEYYNNKGALLYDIPIAFQKENNWKEKVYLDEVSGKIYTLFRKNGISTLKEISLKTGKLVNSIEIPNFIFVDNIKIRDNVVYFLYKENIHQEYQQLYKMHI